MVWVLWEIKLEVAPEGSPGKIVENFRPMFIIGSFFAGGGTGGAESRAHTRSG